MAVIRVHGGALNSQTLAGSLRYFEIVGPANSFRDTIGDRGQRVAEFNIVSGGINFVAGDIGSTLSVTGGTSSTTATFTISGVSGGAITKISQLNAGVYTVLPANPVATSGGTGSGCTLQLGWSSTIIIPGTTSFVAAGQPVVRSTADQVCEVLQQRATIVQVAVMPLDLDRFTIAVENTSLAWDTGNDGDPAPEMEAAVQAMGTITVPDDTSTGTTFDLSGATVDEKFLGAGFL